LEPEGISPGTLLGQFGSSLSSALSKRQKSKTTQKMLIRIASEVNIAQELCQTDQEGKVVPTEKQTVYCAQIPLTCQAPDNSINLGFLVTTEVVLRRISSLPTDQHLIAVAHLTAKQAAICLSKASSWDLYRSREILIQGSESISAQSQEEFSAEIALTNDLIKAFQEATKRHSVIDATFEWAKDFLTSHLHSIFHVRSEARAAAQFLAHCMRSDGQPYMYGWNREKAAILVRIIEDLGGRKNPNHHGYTSALG
jgi:hypothetical protein